MAPTWLGAEREVSDLVRASYSEKQWAGHVAPRRGHPQSLLTPPKGSNGGMSELYRIVRSENEESNRVVGSAGITSPTLCSALRNQLNLLRIRQASSCADADDVQDNSGYDKSKISDDDNHQPQQTTHRIPEDKMSETGDEER